MKIVVQLFVYIFLVVSGDEVCGEASVCNHASGDVLLQSKSTKQRIAMDVKDRLVPRPTPAYQGWSVPLQAWMPKFRKLRDEKHARVRRRALLQESQHSGLNGTTMRSATSDEKQAFLDMHNLFRCMHGVPAVVWNDDVAADANVYISPMTEMVHAASYAIPPPAGPAGENLAWSSASLSAADAVQMWYDEVNYCKGGPEHFTDGCADDEHGVTGHFTAMIWEGVKEIGCAFSDSAAPTVIICRYKSGDELSLDTPNMNHPDNYPNHVHPRSKTECQCEGHQDEVSKVTVFTKHPNHMLTGTAIAMLQSPGFHGTEAECEYKCLEVDCAGFGRVAEGPDAGHCDFYSEVITVAEAMGTDAYVMTEEPAVPAPINPDVPEVTTVPPPAVEEFVPADVVEPTHAPVDESSCQGNSDAFSAGYGPCSTYAAGKGNHGYCDMDRDKMSQLLASEVCEECGQCGAGAGSAASAPKKEAPVGSDPDEWVDPTKCKYADPNWHCKGYQCVPKDQYQWYSAAGGAWCLTSGSSYCQQPDHSWCDGTCSCPGMCPHACGRCPP